MAGVQETKTPAEGLESWWLGAPWLFLLFWSGGYTFARLGLPYIEPMTLLSIRFLIAFVIMALFLTLSGARLPRDPYHWLSLAITGLLMQAGYFGFSYLAMKNGVDAGTASVIMSLQPIIVAAFAPLLLSEKTSWRLWMGLALGLSGTLIVIRAGHEFTASSLEALGFALAGLASITLATLFEKRFGRKTHPVVNGVIHYLVGGLVLAPIALMTEDQPIIWHRDLIIALIYLVGINSIISIALLVGLIQRGQASRISTLFFLVPPLAYIWSWLVNHETIPLMAWPGLALSCLGLILIGYSSRRELSRPSTS